MTSGDNSGSCDAIWLKASGRSKAVTAMLAEMTSAAKSCAFADGLGIIFLERGCPDWVWEMAKAMRRVP